MGIEPFEFEAGVVGCELPIGPWRDACCDDLAKRQPLFGGPACWECGGAGIVSSERRVRIRPCRANFHAWACNAIRTALLVGGPRPRERPHRAKPRCACWDCLGPAQSSRRWENAYPTVLSTPVRNLSLIHISEPTRRTPISYAVFCLK